MPRKSPVSAVPDLPPNAPEVPVAPSAPVAPTAPHLPPPPPNPESAYQAPPLPTRQQREFPKVGQPITDIAVIIGVTDKMGQRQEILYNLASDDIRIVKCSHSLEEKVKQMKDEDGALLGFEPTGEYVLKLEAKYIKE